MHLEGLNCVLVVGRYEHDVGPIGIARRKQIHYVEAVKNWHLYV